MNHPASTVAYYNQVSPIGKPILDLLCIEYRESCIATICSLEYYSGWNFCALTGIKYLWRMGQKTKDYRDDIRKSIEYFEWAITDEFNELPSSKILSLNLAISALNTLLDKQNKVHFNDTI